MSLFCSPVAKFPYNTPFSVAVDASEDGRGGVNHVATGGKGGDCHPSSILANNQ